MPVQIVYVRYTFSSRSASSNSFPLISAGRASTDADRASSFSASNEVHISAAAARHRESMKGWFSQIVIGIIVTVIGTIVANALVSGRSGRHLFHGFHWSGPDRPGR
jgi:hypothetical protein